MTFVNMFNTNLDYYRVFYYVVKYKSITLASKKLSLTQPSVTRTIHRLEEDLGCPLLERGKRGTTLTAEGRVLWPKIESAMKLILAAERELEAIQSLDSGSMRIASMEMGFSEYILPAMRRFLQDYPNIKVKFQTKIPNEISAMLSAGLIDLAMQISPFEMDHAFEYHNVNTFRESLIVGPQYAFLASEERTLEELSKYPFISMPEGSSAKEYMKNCFHKCGLVYEPDIEVTSLGLLIKATAENFGIGTIPSEIVAQQLKSGELLCLKIKEPLPERCAFAVTNRSIVTNRATKIFINDYLKPQNMLL